MSINAQPFNPSFKLIGNLEEDQVLVYDVSENAFVNSAGSGGAGASGFTQAVNEGAGFGVFKGTAGTTLQFKTLLGGSDITIVDNGDALVINGTLTETPQDGTNIGTGTAIFDAKDETTHALKFKSLAVGAGLTLTDDGAGTLTLTNTATGGGGVAGADTTLSNLSDNSVARANLDVYSKSEADTNYLKTDAHSIPSQDNTYDIGSPSRRYNDIYAETFQGIAVLADNLTIDGTAGQILTYNGSTWVAADNAGAGGGGGGGSLPQSLSLSGADLTISGGNTVDLSTLPGSSFDGAYASLTGKPTLFDGTYASLTGAPTLPTDVSDLTDTGNLLGGVSTLSALTDIASAGASEDNMVLYYDHSTTSFKWKSTGAHFDGDYNSLSNKPTIPTLTSELTNDSGFVTTDTDTTYTAGTGLTLTGTEFSLTAGHFSGAYADLTGKPTIPTDISQLSDATNIIQAANTDSQSLTLTGSSLQISGGNAVDLSGISGTTTLSGLTDTTLSNVQTYNFIQWDGSAWVNDYASIRHLADVDSVGALSDNDTLVWNAVESQFEFQQYFNGEYASLINKPILVTSIDDLDDVTLSSVADGQFLKYNNVSGEWENETVSLFDGDYNSLTNKPTLFDGNYANLTNQPAIPVNLSDLTNVSSVAPADGQHLVWNNSTGLWTPSAASTGGSSYSDTDARNAISATTGLSYNNSTGVMGLNASISDLLDVSSSGVTNGQVLKWNSTTSVWEPGDDTVLTSTDQLSEGTNNLYFTQAKFDSSLGTKSTDDLAEGSNEYYTNAKVDARLTSQLQAGSNITLTPGVGGIITISSLSGSSYGDSDVTSHLATFDGHIIPDTDVTYDLGSSSKRFRDLYLSGSTIDLGGSTLKRANGTGKLQWDGVDVQDYNNLSNKPDLSQISNPGGNPFLRRTDLAVTTGSASGSGALSYNTSNGSFTFTPADLSSYLTSVPAQTFASLTGKPTTISGYGITDAFNGDYNNLSNKPSLFDGAYSSLTGTPTIPSDLTDLSISDGTNGQVLTTDGSGNFTFTTVSGGSGSNADTLDSQDGTYYLDYNNFTNTPSIPTAFSGDYDDLTNKPTLFDGAYASLTGTPSLFDGDYNSLTNKPTIPTENTAGTGIQINTGVISLDASLSDLTNVVSTAPTSGQVLKWNGTAWAPGSDNASASTAMNDITDTNISSPSDNDILYYDNATSQWKNQPLTSHVNFYDTTDFTTDFASKSITNLGDVNTNGITTGQYLEWNGTAFIPATPSSGGGASAINDLSDVDTNTSAPSNGDVLTWSASNSEWAPQAPASGGGGGGSNIEYFKLNYATNGNLTSITNATSGVSATILSATGGDVEISFSGTNYPPAGILIYGYARSTNEYVIMPLNKDITTRKVAGGGSAGSPIAFGSMGSVDLTLKMRESDTGASRSFGTDTHAWIMFTLI